MALTALFLIAVFGVTSCGWSCGGRVSPTQLYRRNATSPGGENSFPNLSPTHVHDKLSCGRGNKVMQFVGCGTQCWMKQTSNKETRKAQNKQIKNQNQTRVSNQTWNTFKSRHSALKPFNFFTSNHKWGIASRLSKLVLSNNFSLACWFHLAHARNFALALLEEDKKQRSTYCKSNYRMHGMITSDNCSNSTSFYSPSLFTVNLL